MGPIGEPASPNRTTPPGPSRARARARGATRLLRVASFVVFHSAVLRLQAVLTKPSARPRLRAERQRWACRHICRVIGIDVHVDPAARHDAASLIVANHLGPFDAIILSSVFPVAFVGKAELLRWPLIGWVCRSVGLIGADRASRMSSRALVEAIRERIADNVSVLAFPEGTTSDGSAVAPFKTGAFEAAGYGACNVLPVAVRTTAINGTALRDPAGSALTWSDPAVSFASHCWGVLGIAHADVAVAVGRPIPTIGRDRRILAAEAHSAVSSLYRRLPGEGPSRFNNRKPRTADTDNV